MNGKKAPTTRKRCKRLLKQIDHYGQPVSLTYKKEPQITSALGGLATILARLLILIFLGYECKSVIKKEYTLQTSIKKFDLTTEMAGYNITLGKEFDFAIKLDYVYAS